MNFSFCYLSLQLSFKNLSHSSTSIKDLTIAEQENRKFKKKTYICSCEKKGVFRMAAITENTKKEVKKIVYDFFADECEVDPAEINDNTNIIKDLDGDSLMFLELIEIFKKKYNLDIELKTIGKYAVKHPVQTIGQLIHMQLLIIEHENKLLELEK